MNDRVVSKELAVIALYQGLEQLLESEDYGECQRRDLKRSFPNYIEMLKKRQKDLEKTDHGIVFAGETSSGKTTLINKMLGKKIFSPKTHESTSTICKIRNSNQIRITVEPTSGDTIVTDLTTTCDVETEEGVKMIRDALAKLTDLTVSLEGKTYRSIDIGFPIPILKGKGNTIFVDTPGIGGSAEVTRQLVEYLPNAVSLVFVINVGSAGGLLRDRLPEILRSVRDRSENNEMPCFKPEDAIFITNKWDTLSTDDGDNEEEMETTWETLKIKLKEEWPFVQEENIFKLNLKDVSPQKSNWSTKEFAAFREKLDMNIEKAKNIREKHLGYLQTILTEISKLLNDELTSNKERQNREASTANETQEKMQNLDKECKEKRCTLLSKTEQLIHDTVEEIFQDLDSPQKKDKILNPDGSTPILRILWSPYEYEKKVKTRVERYIDQKFQTSLTKFKKIENEIQTFYEETNKEIIKLKTMSANEMNLYWEIYQCSSHIGFDYVAPLQYPLFTAIAAAGLIVLTVLSPVILPLFLYKEQTSNKKELIDEAYNKLKSTVRTNVKNELETKFGKPLSATIRSFTDEIFHVLKTTQEKTTWELQSSLNEILARRRVLEDLLRKVHDIDDKASNLQD